MGLFDARRIIVGVLGLALFYIGFLVVNVQLFVAFVYFILGIAALVVLFGIDKVAAPRFDLNRANSDTTPLWIYAVTGLAIGAGYFLLIRAAPSFSVVNPQAGLYLPVLPLATADQWATIGGVAPIVEEIAFRGALLSILIYVFAMPFWIANIAQALGFGAYHIYAYAGVFSISGAITVSGALLVAVLLGLILGYSVRNADGTISLRKLVRNIPAHFAFNFLILLLVGVGQGALLTFA